MISSGWIEAQFDGAALEGDRGPINHPLSDETERSSVIINAHGDSREAPMLFGAD